MKQDGIVNSVDSKNGNYPLHIAAQNGHKEVVELLVGDGNCVVSTALEKKITSDTEVTAFGFSNIMFTNNSSDHETPLVT